MKLPLITERGTTPDNIIATNPLLFHVEFVRRHVAFRFDELCDNVHVSIMAFISDCLANIQYSLGTFIYEEMLRLTRHTWNNWQFYLN